MKLVACCWDVPQEFSFQICQSYPVNHKIQANPYFGDYISQRLFFLQGSVSYGAGEPTSNEYYSTVYYHSATPKWGEMVKVSEFIICK